MLTNKSAKVCSAVDLEAINIVAVSKNYNRTISEDGIRKLDPNGVNIVVPLMLHEHAQGQVTFPHMRCQVLMKLAGSNDPEYVTLDVPLKHFDRLKDVSKAILGAESK